MILIAAIITSIFIALLRGGRLIHLASLSFRFAWLALAAFVFQYVLAYGYLHGPAALGLTVANLVMIGSYALLLGVLWVNRRLPGIPLVALGLLLNLLVMLLNGGWMPITPEALAQLGFMSRVSTGGSVARVWSTKDVMIPRELTRLWPLSDVFVLAAPFPIPSAFSPGDVLVALGLFWLLQQALIKPTTGPVVDAQSAVR